MKKIFRMEPHVRSMIDEDGAILLDLKAGKYYSLNSVAAALWTRAEQDMDEEQILDELETLYRVGPEQLEADIRELVIGLEKKGLVRLGA